MKVAFLVNDLQLSGGVGVVMQHAGSSRCTTASTSRSSSRATRTCRAGQYETLAHLASSAWRRRASERFDVVVATWWETCSALFELEADRYAYFVQSLEDRFYQPDEPNRIGAGADARPARRVHHRGALDRGDARRAAPRRLLPPRAQRHRQGDLRLARRGRAERARPLRVLVEGSPSVWFKGVHEAIEAVTRDGRAPSPDGGRRRPRGPGGRCRPTASLGPVSQREMAGLYAESDVLSRCRASRGCTARRSRASTWARPCVTTEVTGHDEYVEHGWNGLVVRLGRPARRRAAARPARPRPRAAAPAALQRAAHRARSWPAWEQAGPVHGRGAPAPSTARRRRTPTPPRGGWSPTCGRASRCTAATSPSGSSTRGRSSGWSASRRCPASRRRAAPGARSACSGRWGPRCCAWDASCCGERLGSRLRRRLGGEPEAPTAARPPHGLLDLLREGPAPLEPGGAARADAESLRLAIVIPPFRHGSGGHSTLANLVRGLEARGHVCSLWLADDEGRHAGETDEQTEALFKRFFGDVRAGLRSDLGGSGGADVVVATGWQTVPVALRAAGGRGARLPRPGPRARVLRDVGRGRVGRRHLPPGPALHLREPVARRGGARALRRAGHALRPRRRPRDLPPRRPRAPRRPRRSSTRGRSTPRRAVPLGLLALTELHRRRPDVEIGLFGESRTARRAVPAPHARRARRPPTSPPSTPRRRSGWSSR